MANHVGPQTISQGNSIAFSCYGIPKNLVIFVHGFNGHPVKTWNEFPQLIQQHGAFKDADVIFYGYDSLKTQASNMKLRLFKFIEMAIDPTKMVYATLRNIPEGFQYNKVVIIAHSLGAVVARLALLYARAKHVSWLKNCQLLFFAPAHFGSRIPDNFRECFQGYASLFQSFTVTKYPIIKDLSEGSTILSQLENNVREILQKENAEYLKAKVVWASNDIVVLNNTFCDDFPEDEIDDTSHTSVCKPLPDKLIALNHVCNCI